MLYTTIKDYPNELYQCLKQIKENGDVEYTLENCLEQFNPMFTGYTDYQCRKLKILLKNGWKNHWSII